MSLVLRLTVFLDGQQRPDNYEVRDDGQTVSAASTACGAPGRAARQEL
jgi:hypothetical protein